ncbi:cyclic nucleotide-binding domain-containing protein [Aquabacterium sp.]|uniref:cyclic nucleotide-binding domain-containing protein n=1 Tax=Aquabacterium sp. TaxID=1872578 RepID=UPI003784D540
MAKLHAPSLAFKPMLLPPKPAAKVPLATPAPAPVALLPVIAGGLVSGLVAAVSSASFAALLFNGPLAAFVGQALGWAMLATLAHLLVLARLCSLPGTLGSSQSLPIAVLAAAMGAAVQAASAQGGSATSALLLGTAAATLVIGTALTGAVLLLLGRAGAGRLARFLPYPVLVGVMASSGWLLAAGALRMLRGPVAGADIPWMALGASAWAVLMLVAHRLRPHPLTTLVMLTLGALLCHGLAGWLGWSQADMVRAGWLLAVPPAAPIMPVLGDLAGASIHWSAVASAAPLLAVVPAVTAIALLMNAAALETAAGQPLDLNRELRAAGAANLAAAVLGGLPGYHQLGLSSMNLRLGLRQRRIALWAALPCVAALLAGPSVLLWLPLPAMGALLLFLALQMIYDALLGSWVRLSGLERAIVALVIGTTALAGFLAGMVAGLFAAVLLFAVYSARVDPVWHEVSGAAYGSRVARGRAIDDQVRSLGAAVQVLQLQGFLFFGIADRLQHRVQARLTAADRPPLRYLVLDCRRVLGSDSSAIHSFWLVAQALAPAGVVLVVAHAPRRMRAQLEAAGLGPGPRCKHVEDLDRGLEWCEEALLNHDLGGSDDTAHTQSIDAMSLARLLHRLPRIELPAGGRLIAQGSSDRDLYILAKGSVSATRSHADGGSVRLQTARGSIVVLGEIGFFTGRPRTADVIADTPSVVLHLSRDELDRLERDEPALALALYKYIGLALARRVAHLVGVVDALEG